MLETKSIVKKFSNVKALDNVSFNIEAGEIYALLGANGSGKTTWMKIAASLTKASSGEVLYNGKPVGIESRKEIAYMSTEPYFYSWMSVKDVGNYYKDFFEDFSMDKYHELLEKMDLEENLKVKNLSSGMVAKLKIAVTMARNAKIYLLDEPLNGIDLIARDTIMETIIERMREDVAIVLSSHLVEEIESFVGKAIFIHKGKVMDMCDVESLRDNDGKSLVDRYREIMK